MTGAGKDRTKAPALGPDSPIPDKLYFKIGEVAELVGVQGHVLRYWEKEIPSIRPGKSASNQRRYRYRDVEMFREIKRLLYRERYTLAGAKKRLMGGMESVPDSQLTSKQRVAAALPQAVRDASEAPRSPLVSTTPLAPIPDQHVAEMKARVRKGLCDLIRLAGEEP